jgi:hypothetical protein
MELDNITEGSLLNNIYDIGGKRIGSMEEIVGSLMKMRHERKMMLNLPALVKVMKAYADGYGT